MHYDLEYALNLLIALQFNMPAGLVVAVHEEAVVFHLLL
jgi:hypothetical protein